MADTTSKDDELEQRVHDITQTMLIALSEWQAGTPVDYSTAKQHGRDELVKLIKQYGIQARIDQLNLYKQRVVISSHMQDHTVGMNIIDSMITELTALKDKENKS